MIDKSLRHSNGNPSCHSSIRLDILLLISSFSHMFIRMYVHTFIRSDVHTFIRSYVSTFIRQYVLTASLQSRLQCITTYNKEYYLNYNLESIIYRVLIYQLPFVKSCSTSLQKLDVADVTDNWNSWLSRLQLSFLYGAIVIWCYQAFWFCRSQRNPSGFCKVCFELHETDFAAQNPCRILVGLTPKS